MNIDDIDFDIQMQMHSGDIETIKRLRKDHRITDFEPDKVYATYIDSATYQGLDAHMLCSYFKDCSASSDRCDSPNYRDTCTKLEEYNFTHIGS